MMLLTWVNLSYYQHLMAEIRNAIAGGRYDDAVDEIKAGWHGGLSEN